MEGSHKIRVVKKCGIASEDLCQILRNVLQSYREEIDEFVKYIAQPHKIPVLKTNNRSKIRTSGCR